MPHRRQCARNVHDPDQSRKTMLEPMKAQIQHAVVVGHGPYRQPPKCLTACMAPDRVHIEGKGIRGKEWRRPETEVQFNQHSFTKKPAVIFFISWSRNKSHV